MSMKLSAELFNQIVSSLKSDGTSTRGAEKRAEGRVGLRCTIDIVPCSFNAQGCKPISVSVNNISACGIGIVTNHRMDNGVEFIARFIRDVGSPVPVLYKVRHTRRLANELYSVGAAFARVLPDATGEVIPMRQVAKKQKSKNLGKATGEAQVA